MSKKIVILGAYGQQNIGDEAMLLVLVEYLRKQYPDCVISCNSNSPRATSKDFGVEAFYTSPKKDFFKKLGALLKADAYIYGGGSLLVELRMNPLGRRAPLYRGLIINLLGRCLGKRVVYAGVGAEAVRPGFSQWLVRRVVALSHRCYVRDRDSYNTLISYGCSPDKVKLGAELAFMMQAQDAPKGKKRVKRICVLPVYRILGYDECHESYVTALKQAADSLRKKGIEVDFYAMQTDPNDDMGDKQIISKITGDKPSAIKPKKQLGPKEFIDYLSGYDLVLSSRYHGIICMLLAGRPAISLTEFEKSQAVLKAMGLAELSLSSKDISATNLLKAIQDVDNNYADLLGTVGQGRQKLHKKADDMLAEMKKDIAKD